MATGNSNTYVLPSQGASIAVSRTQFNSSLRAVLQNFYSAGAPSTDNLIDSGSAMGESDYNGMLFRNSTTGMLYISDSAISNPIPNFSAEFLVIESEKAFVPSCLV